MRAAKENAVLFVKSGRVAEVITGSIEDYWNNIYDWLYDSDFMVIENVDGTPLGSREVNRILKLLIEDMSEDGYPLIWHKYRGALFLALDWRAAPFGRIAFKQYRNYLDRETLEDIFGKSQTRTMGKRLARTKYRPPRRHEKFDFYGFLTSEVIERGRPVKYRLSLEEILRRTERPVVKSNYARSLQQYIVALKPFIQQWGLFRDRDLEELVDFLWDQFSDVLEDEGYRIEPWTRASSLWTDRPADDVRDRVPMGLVKLAVLARALRPLNIDDEYLHWLQRCIVKLFDDEDLRLDKSVRHLSDFLFDLLEDGAKTNGTCIWCGETGISPDHYDVCRDRYRALFGATGIG